MPAGLDVVIPALNEQSRLGNTIEALRAAAKRVGIECNIIVVDDASCDATSRVASGLGVTVIRNVKRLGICGAFKKGVEKCRNEYVMLCPADARNFDFLSDACSLFGEYDVISVSKRHPLSEVKDFPRRRWLMSNTYQRIVSLLFHVRTSDTHFVKLYRKSMLLKILPRSRIEGAVGETELIVLLGRIDASFIDIPSLILHCDEGSTTDLHVIVRTILDIGRLMLLAVGQREALDPDT